jgi:hypothetical protein
MAEYRAGHDAEAVNWLARFAPQTGGGHGDASAFSLLAMAQHRIGRTREAGEALAEAKRIIAGKLPDPGKGQLFGGDDFQEWAFCQTLCREAEHLLSNGPPANTQPSPLPKPRGEH